jgi:mannose-6-phosphate isomerase
VKPGIVKLRNPIQHYAWGSHEALAMLQGRPGPTREPEAELWVGDHPTAPSEVEEAGAHLGLPDWIARDPDAVLAPGRRRLPFLVKILAARASLSVQVHPDAAQAERGFERESRARIATTERSYSDRNAKHEMLVALSRFEALCGLRSDEDVARLSGLVPGGAFAALAQTSCANQRPGRAAALFHRLQCLDEREKRELLGELERFAGGAGSREARWMARLLVEHPGDPLAAAPMLLNPVVLAPGSALVVRPGTLHAYLSGTGVEVMTPSDNVVRGGLTNKHVDRDELRVLARDDASPAETVAPEIDPEQPGTAMYATGCEDFSVRSCEVGAEVSVERPGGRVAVVLCVAGAVEATSLGANSSQTVVLDGADAALVPASAERYRLRGRAPFSRVFEISAGPAPALPTIDR